MNVLFAKQNILSDKYDVFPSTVEKYQTNKMYDFVIAEGFLPNVYNQEEIINKLQKLVNKNGIVVITCNDDVSYFVEIMKRIVALTITKDMPNYEEKVNYLADFFAPQLAKLRGVSRSPKEWVQDQILNPAGINGMELSLLQAIEYFGNEFDVLGSSPQMFTDYSWYKDVWYDYKKDYEIQFRQKRLSFLLANMPEVILKEKQADALVKHFSDIRKYEVEFEKTLDSNILNTILQEMYLIEDIVKSNFEDKFVRVYDEIKQILLCILDGKDVNIEEYPNFFMAFGRSQQYISFVKKDKNGR